MTREFVKYLPHNTRPEEFMRPPTEASQRLTIGVCREMETEINQRATSLLPTSELRPVKRRLRLRRSRHHSEPLNSPISPGLKVGSEIELLIFSPDSVPHLDKMKPQEKNPNYTKEHMDIVADIAHSVGLPTKKGGLTEALQRDITRKRIFMEIRTQPGSVEDYIAAMQKIKDWFQKAGKDANVHPVVFSQHLHLSVTGHAGNTNLLGAETDEMRSTYKGIVDIYHRAFPFLMLPENFDGDPLHIGTVGEAIYIKGRKNKPDNPLRIEGRLNSSEYAIDPYLNLLVHLVGIYRGLSAASHPETLDEDYPLLHMRDGISPHEKPFFTIGEGHPERDETLCRMLTDPVLQEHLPPDLINGLVKVFQGYPDISRGITTAADSRKAAVEIFSSVNKAPSQ